MDLAFSHPIGFMKQGEDVSTIIESLTALFGITRILTTFPELQRFLNLKWVYRFLASKPSDDHGPGMIRGVRLLSFFYIIQYFSLMTQLSRSGGNQRSQTKTTARGSV